MAFFKACHIDMWDIVENGNYILTNKEGIEIRSSSNKEQKTRYLPNSKARNFPMCALTESKYEKAHSCKSSKEMLDTLALAYEDMSQVRNSKISMLVHKYELFKMEDNEAIDLILPRRCKPQVITLRASKDLKKLPMEELLDTLKDHGMKLNKDEGQRKGKSIALKA
ncbi:hypothetical protein CR513_48038, partial [Mucuna pruriens]